MATLVAPLRDARGRFVAKTKTRKKKVVESSSDTTIDQLVEEFDKTGAVEFCGPGSHGPYRLELGRSIKGLPVRILWVGDQERKPAFFPGGGWGGRELNIFLQGVGIENYGHKQSPRSIVYAYLMMIDGGFKPETIACGQRLTASGVGRY